MKRFFYSFFIFCAGSDRRLLDTCPTSEHIKHALLGGLVLIPATIASLTMSFTISTATENGYIYCSIGLLWAIFIFIFDRFIVATFRKADSVKWDIFSIAFLGRLALSIPIGLLISHPVVLWNYEDSINKKMGEVDKNEINNIRNSYYVKIDSVQEAINTIDTFLNVKQEKKNEQSKLIEREVAGEVGAGFSGFRGRASATKEKKATFNILKKELDSLIAQKNIERTRLNTNIVTFERERDSITNNYKSARDYLAREEALTQLSEERPALSFRKNLYIVCLILMDVLAVSLKAVIKKGPYDNLLTLQNESIEKLCRKTGIEIGTQMNRIIKNPSIKTFEDKINELRIILKRAIGYNLVSSPPPVKPNNFKGTEIIKDIAIGMIQTVIANDLGKQLGILPSYMSFLMILVSIMTASIIVYYFQQTIKKVFVILEQKKNI